MKKIVTTIVAIVLVAVIGVTGYTYLSSDSSHHATKTQSSKSSQSSKSTSSQSSVMSSSEMTSSTSQTTNSSNPETSPDYDPNKTLDGTQVTAAMIQEARQQLIAAGLPADQWGPSDIQKIITQASQDKVSIVEYAKANYHS